MLLVSHRHLLKKRKCRSIRPDDLQKVLKPHIAQDLFDVLLKYLNILVLHEPIINVDVKVRVVADFSLLNNLFEAVFL